MGLFGKRKNKSAREQVDNAQKADMMSADEAFDIAEAFYNQGKYEESNRYYDIASRQGHARAMNCLGCSYRYGEGVSKDAQKALCYFEEALEGGYSKAAGQIGQMYYYGEDGIEKDFEKALPLLQKSALDGNGFAMHTLSDAYYVGNGCESNEKLAAYWAYQAVEHQNEYGYYWLGTYFDKGIFFYECPAVAKFYFEKAVECGFDADEYLQSEKYRAVDAVEPDYIKFNDSDPAFFTQECPHRQYLRALSMLDGKGTDGNTVPIDAAGGQRMLELSAEQGYADAQYSLGAKFIISNEGEGIRYDEDGAVVALGHDTEKALYYLDLAAMQGHLEALDTLILYGTGDIETEQDTGKSAEYQAIRYRLFQDRE